MKKKYNGKEESALYIATAYGSAEFLKILVEMPGIDVNTKNDGTDTPTPLMYALENNK